MTTGSFFAIAANSSEVISSKRTRRNPREGHKWFAKFCVRLTLNKLNMGREAFSAPWPCDSCARGQPVLRRQGLHLRDLRRDATGLGRGASALDRTGGPRLDALPHAEPAPHAAPGGGDANPPDPRDRRDRRGR